MRSLTIFLLLAALCPSCASTPPEQALVRALFVGNSLTYVGNLPAVFDGLAKANGRATQSSMIAAGGATLTRRVIDGSVERALASGRFDYLVLQERGGDFLGSFGAESKTQAEASLLALAATARRYGANPVLLGTYQLHSRASAAIVTAESDAARKTSIPYLAISSYLQTAMAAHPDMQWFFSDGMHPGHDLILLNAALLFRHIFGVTPSNHAITVAGPMYVPSATFGSEVQPAHGLSDVQDFGHVYTAEQVARITGQLLAVPQAELRR